LPGKWWSLPGKWWSLSGKWDVVYDAIKSSIVCLLSVRLKWCSAPIVKYSSGVDFTVHSGGIEAVGNKLPFPELLT
jgi:hypothetical protein